MIKVNKLTDYAVLILSHFAAQQSGTVFNAHQLAQAIGVNPPTVSKILKILLRHDLLLSHRGANGGYQLAKPVQYINIAQIIQAMEGRLGVTDCSVHPGLCSQENTCQMRLPWQKINKMVLQVLSTVTLADMVQKTGDRTA
jgi:FeS assembly SUF system regulator